MGISILKELPKGVFIKFRENQLDKVRKSYDLDEQKLRESIGILRDWLEKQAHFNITEVADVHFEKLLISSKGSVERAKVRLEKLGTLKTIWPRYFTAIDVNLTRKELEAYKSILLPEITEDGARISLTKVYTNALPVDIFVRFTKYVVTLCEYVILHHYPNGFIVIMDYREVNVFELLALATRHFTQVQQCLAIIMEGYGMRVKGIHVITPSKAADALITFSKLVLSNKLASRVHVHATPEAIYEYVPKKILPSDLGGDAASISEMQENLLKDLGSVKLKEHVAEAHHFTIDASKKPTRGCIDDFGMPGSFRTLSVD